MTTKEELVQLLSRPIVFQMPKRLLPPPSWTMHTPYAMWLIDVLRPRTFVELGAFKGTSYCAFCQAIKELQLDTKCFAVDTWQGDPHSNFYGGDVFEDLSQYHDENYAEFSKMVRKDFDSALPDFKDGSIDLLHIDGFHTYEAVKHDFETWLPKVSKRGVVLFHDISVREKDFGVWRYWEEIKGRYPHLEVHFGNGLGTLLVGSEVPENFQRLVRTINESNESVQVFQGFFEHLGRPCVNVVEQQLLVVEEQLLNETISRHLKEIDETSRAWEVRGAEIDRLQGVAAALRAEVRRPWSRVGFRRKTKEELEQSPLSPADREAATRKIRAKLAYFSERRIGEILAISVEQVLGVAAAKLMKWAWAPGSLQPLRSGTQKLLISQRIKRQASLIEQSGLFDENFYREQLGLSFQVNFPLIAHFLLVGGRTRLSPHPLFDTRYYCSQLKSFKERFCNPLVHYLTVGWREGRSPHVLFDVPFYRAQEGAGEMEPLQHFLKAEAGRYLNPNRLFDANYYLSTNASELPKEINPLTDFIMEGATEGLRCHPLFDPGFYLAQYPDVHAGSWNPLTHYLLHGWREGRFAAPSVDLGMVAPTEGVYRIVAQGKRPPVATLPLFIVYGAQHVNFLKNVFLPALDEHRGSRILNVHFLNYADNTPLLSDLDQQENIRFQDWSASREAQPIGFGEAHNHLFSCVKPPDCFIIVNPDSTPLAGCFDTLCNTYQETSAGIVEARQWPRAHPKEYHLESGDTPWASGAFSLIDSKVFSEIGGFDPVFYLYGEDVDLSWRFWLAGRRVVHEPKAICAHFTGMYTYREDRFYHEHFFSTRNFLVLARKFFGVQGEERALALLASSGFPAEIRSQVVESYMAMRSTIKMTPAKGHPMIKILGMNVYHFPQPSVQSLGLEQVKVVQEPVAHVG